MFAWVICLGKDFTLVMVALQVKVTLLECFQASAQGTNYL